MIKKLKFFFTNALSKIFMLEVELKLYFSGKNKILRKYFQRRIYYKYNCEVSHSAKLENSVKFVHPIAKLIGDINIGRNCIIGANAVVTKSIPNDSVVVGVNKIIKTLR